MQPKLHLDIIHIEFYDKEDVHKYLKELQKKLLDEIWRLSSMDNFTEDEMIKIINKEFEWE